MRNTYKQRTSILKSTAHPNTYAPKLIWDHLTNSNNNYYHFVFIYNRTHRKRKMEYITMQCNAMTIMGTGASLYAHILLTIMCTKTFQFML